MSDTRTSREIIWQHAFDYRWNRVGCVGLDPLCDLFNLRWPDDVRAPLLVVHYAKNGRVVDAFLNGLRLPRCNRDSVMDVIEGRHAR